MQRLSHYISLFLVLCCGVACSTDDQYDDDLYPLTNIHITTECDLYGVPGTMDGFFMITAFNGDEAFVPVDDVYASFCVFTNNSLRFIGEGTDAAGVVHITNDSGFTHENVNLLNLPYAYYQRFFVSTSGSGEYLFEIKFYQPSTNRYFVSRRYRLTVWNEQNFSCKYELTLAE